MKRLFAACSYIVSKIHAPFNHKRISELDCLQILRMVKPGDVLLTHTKGELSNFFLDHWGHAAIVSRFGLYEAVTAGVKKSDLMFFLSRKDHVMILRPSFAVDEVMLQQWCEKVVGTLYDYNFESDDKRLYCFELAADAIEWSSGKAIKQIQTLAGKKYLGKSFYEDPRFQIMFISKP